MKIEVEVSIPALNRLCGWLEKHGASLTLPTTAPTVATEKEEPKTPKEPKPAKEAKAPKESKKEEPKVTVDDVVKVGKELVSLTNATKLRAVLDTVISPDEKITTCDPSHYPALLAALEKAVAAEKEEL
jgi:hypothetical protein